jgi:hypothetical protein
LPGRVFDTGNARKTDATDAYAVAMVALRTPRLNRLAYDEELVSRCGCSPIVATSCRTVECRQ